MVYNFSLLVLSFIAARARVTALHLIRWQSIAVRPRGFDLAAVVFYIR